MLMRWWITDADEDELYFNISSSRAAASEHLQVTYLLPGQTICFNRAVDTQVFGIIIWAQPFKQTSGFGMLPSCLPGAFLSICGYTKSAISSGRKHSRHPTAAYANEADGNWPWKVDTDSMERTRRPIEDSFRHTAAEEVWDSRASARERMSCGRLK